MNKRSVKCPSQTVKILSPLCGEEMDIEGIGRRSVYGALGHYCYPGTKDWWFKESVKKKLDTCNPGSEIQQSKSPGKSDEPNSPCIRDWIFNLNGPPASVGECKTVTEQTVFAGPTELDVEQCSYQNKQVVEITVDKGSNFKSGKVKTSSGGESRSCAWKEPG